MAEMNRAECVLCTLAEVVGDGEARSAGLKMIEPCMVAVGAETITVRCAGYELEVMHLDGVLVSIRAKGRTPGEMIVTPWGRGWTIAGRHYLETTRSARLRDALAVAALAWEAAGGDVGRFYTAIGSRGQCAICGRPMSDAVSMARGIGPECMSRRSDPAIDLIAVAQARIRTAERLATSEGRRAAASEALQRSREAREMAAYLRER